MLAARHDDDDDDFVLASPTVFRLPCSSYLDGFRDRE